MQILKSFKTQLVIYLVCLAIFLAAKDKSSAFLFSTGLAVFFALSIEAAVLYFKTRSFRLTSSSAITGLIIGFVLSSDQPWWQFLAACVLAILSKHLIVFKKKHIFNPAAFGIFLTLVLCGASTQWQGTYAWYILIPYGLYFAQRFRKLRIVLSYFLVALALFAAQAFAQRVPLGNILGYLSYFFIFVMVIEPKTSPAGPRRQLVFGAGIAVLIFILTEWGLKFDVELFSLLFWNAAVLIVPKVRLKPEVAG